MESIGPSKCDNKRDIREKHYDKVWKKLVSNNAYSKTYSIFSSSIDLYREALSCYQNGAYMGTAVMCRSATEAALYYSVSRRDFKYAKEWKIIHKANVVSLPSDKLKTLINIGLEERVLSNRILKKFAKIRAYGNYAAHYGKNKDESLNKYALSMTVPTHLTLRYEKEQRKKLGPDYNRKTALKILDMSQYVISHLMKKVLSKAQSS